MSFVSDIYYCIYVHTHHDEEENGLARLRSLLLYPHFLERKKNTNLQGYRSGIIVSVVILFLFSIFYFVSISLQLLLLFTMLFNMLTYSSVSIALYSSYLLYCFTYLYYYLLYHFTYILSYIPFSGVRIPLPRHRLFSQFKQLNPETHLYKYSLQNLLQKTQLLVPVQFWQLLVEAKRY